MPSKDDVTASLKNAANAAHGAFLEAAAIDPVAAKPLWVDSITASNAYLTALQQNLSGNDATIQTAQKALDDQTTAVNNALNDLKNVAAVIGVVGQLVNLVASISKFFA